MKRLLRNRNLWVIGGIVLIAALLLIFGRGGFGASLSALTAGTDPAGGETAPGATAAPEPLAWALVTTSGEQRAYPVYDTEYSVTVSQPGEDGAAMENTLLLGGGGVRVSEANCDNQDCVGQGEVTLENRDMRILGNMIICLPHRVVVELITPEELSAMGGVKGDE